MKLLETRGAGKPLLKNTSNINERGSIMDKKYEVYLCGQIPVGVFNGIRSFVEDYYYTKTLHEIWKKENNEDGSYKDSVQFYLDEIKREAEWYSSNGFEWSHYSFKEVK